MTNAVLITVIGMGLVFLALIFLWGLMALMVRFLKDADETEQPSGETDQPNEEPAGCEQKRKAAAAAVAFALASRQTGAPQPGSGFFAPPSTPSMSAWQSAMRANQLKSKQQRGPAR